MFVVVTEYAPGRPVSMYRVVDRNSAMYLAEQGITHGNVVQTTVFRENPYDANGIGSMQFVATFGRDAPKI